MRIQRPNFSQANGNQSNSANSIAGGNSNSDEDLFLEIVGPDNYFYYVCQQPFGRDEVFLGVNVRYDSSSSAAVKRQDLTDFYQQVLKMEYWDHVDRTQSALVKSIVKRRGSQEDSPSLTDIFSLSYPSAPDQENHVPINWYPTELLQPPGAADENDDAKPLPVKPGGDSGFSGRVALSYIDVKSTYDQIVALSKAGGASGDATGDTVDAANTTPGIPGVLHELRVLDDKLGPLSLAIVSDPVGYEICLVTQDVFDGSTKEAADWKGPKEDSMAFV
jgi:hypothetical protein